VSKQTETGFETYGASDSITFGDNYTTTSSAEVSDWAPLIVLKEVEFGGTVALGNSTGNHACGPPQVGREPSTRRLCVHQRAWRSDDGHDAEGRLLTS